ncbi:MAG: recombinase [Rhodococcus sp. (in: high G+C Gram-positive bacteria)]
MTSSAPRRDLHTWSLFEDWCTALEQPVLPASPESLARFLSAHPAAPATQRRRIAVIDAAHHRRALPPPGRAKTVRAALDVARAARLRDLAAVLGGIIERLPDSGWPSILFARRDALILTLASAGLSYTQVAALRVCDVASSSGEIDALRVETGNGVLTATSRELVRAGVSPSRVYRRWCEVLGHHERYPSTRMLADAIESVGGSELAGYDRHLDPAGQQPLLTAIDRWGHTPLAATPLTSRAIADIVRMHLGGRAPAHLRPRARAQQRELDVAPEPVSTVVLDPGSYERGTRARRNAHEVLGDVGSALADVETRADRLLEGLLKFLASETDEVLTDVVE